MRRHSDDRGGRVGRRGRTSRGGEVHAEDETEKSFTQRRELKN